MRSTSLLLRVLVSALVLIVARDEGIAGTVELVRDRFGVPHVFSNDRKSFGARRGGSWRRIRR
jgi:hypothetical protein